jgi:hypothetical protein
VSYFPLHFALVFAFLPEVDCFMLHCLWQMICIFHRAKVLGGGQSKLSSSVLRQVEQTDLIQYGLIPEFVGRFPIISSLLVRLKGVNFIAWPLHVLGHNHARVPLHACPQCAPLVGSPPFGLMPYLPRSTLRAAFHPAIPVRAKLLCRQCDVPAAGAD